MSHRDDTLLRDALKDFWRVNNYGDDGGASARWVKVELKPMPLFIYIPNFQARRNALAFHDIHHIVTGYGTDLAGEAEIAAWEIGGSCRGYWAAWLLNGMAFCYGWWLLPRRAFRAFVRGRHSRNLYDRQVGHADQDATIGLMKQQLLLDQPVASPTLRDRLVYGLFCVAAATVVIGGLAIAAASILSLIRWLT